MNTDWLNDIIRVTERTKEGHNVEFEKYGEKADDGV